MGIAMLLVSFVLVLSKAETHRVRLLHRRRPLIHLAFYATPNLPTAVDSNREGGGGTAHGVDDDVDDIKWTV